MFIISKRSIYKCLKNLLYGKSTQIGRSLLLLDFGIKLRDAIILINENSMNKQTLNKNWTQEEDAILWIVTSVYSNNWILIRHMLKAKTFEQIRYRCQVSKDFSAIPYDFRVNPLITLNNQEKRVTKDDNRNINFSLIEITNVKMNSPQITHSQLLNMDIAVTQEYTFLKTV